MDPLDHPRSAASRPGSNAWNRHYTYILSYFIAILSLSIFLSAVPGARPLHAQEKTEVLSLPQYLERVSRAAVLFEDSIAANGSSKLLQEAQQVIGEGFQVRLSNEEVITPPPLFDENVDPAIALQRLQSVEAQLQAASQDRTDERLALLHKVLAAPQFAYTPSLWQRFLDWFIRLLGRIWPDSNSAGSSTTTLLFRLLGWLVVGIGIVLIIFLLSYWLQGFLRNFVAETHLRRRRASGEELPLTPGQARQRASLLAQTGNYRQAVRHLYLSMLLTLEDNRLITYDRSLTNQEVLDRGVVSRQVKEQLSPVIDTFDNIWYGIQEPDVETFGDYEKEIDDLANLVTRLESEPKQ